MTLHFARWKWRKALWYKHYTILVSFRTDLGNWDFWTRSHDQLRHSLSNSLATAQPLLLSITRSKFWCCQPRHLTEPYFLCSVVPIVPRLPPPASLLLSSLPSLGPPPPCDHWCWRSLGLSSSLHSSWAHLHPGRGLSCITSGVAFICSPSTQSAEAGGSGIKSDLDYVGILILIQARGHGLCLKKQTKKHRNKNVEENRVSIVSSVVGSFFSGEDEHARLLDPAHASVHGWLIWLKSLPPAPILYSLYTSYFRRINVPAECVHHVHAPDSHGLYP